jgi:hypothetical protein
MNMPNISNLRVSNWLLSLGLSLAFGATVIAQEDVPPIKDGLWKTTVKIESIFTNTVSITNAGIPITANVTGTGTGFLVSREIERNGRKAIIHYLVTNKHMLGGWELGVGEFINSCQLISVHFYHSNIHSLNIQLLDTNGSLLMPERFLVHPNPQVDVAIVPLVFTEQIPIEFDNIYFDVSYLVRFNDKTFLNLGGQIFCLGYPQGLTSLKNNYPMVKSGVLASLPGEEFSFPINAAKSFTGKIYFIDSVIVPGNSGGPVMLPALVKTLLKPDGQLAWLNNPTHNRIIGVVSQSTSAGLGVVYSSDYIIELIEAFEKKIVDVNGNAFQISM